MAFLGFWYWPVGFTRRLVSRIAGLRGPRNTETELEEDIGVEDEGDVAQEASIASDAPDRQAAIEEERARRERDQSSS